MEGLAAETVDDRAEIVGQSPGLCSIAGGVEGIGHERMADMRHMHANLVRAAGLELAAELGDVPALAAEAGFDRIVGDGLAAVLADGLFQAICVVAAERGVDGAAAGLGLAPGESGIGAV